MKKISSVFITVLLLIFLTINPATAAHGYSIIEAEFDIPDEFVVGYGLDYNEIYRNLPYIAILKPEVYS